MKKPVFFLLPPLLLILCLTLFALAAPSGENTPVIALTGVPAYGGISPFEGAVFKEDGKTFDTAEYHIRMYLEQPEWNNFWPKPSFDQPFVELDKNGFFSVSYDPTILSDREGTVFHLFLISSDAKPASYADTQRMAVDHVIVTRGADVETTVVPNREIPSSVLESVAPALPSGLLPVLEDEIAVDVGFYTDGSSPVSPLSENLIRRQLSAVKEFSHTVRFYGAAGELYQAYQTACGMGFTVLGNAWLSNDRTGVRAVDQTANRAELDALIEHCNNGLCKIAIVGSETLLRGDLTAGELVEAIEYVRAGITDETIPVTTADSVDLLISTLSVRNACNLLMPNCYPYWGGSSIDQAAEHFISSITALQAVSGGKEVLVSESGWPTAGQGRGDAKAGEEEAARFYAAVREWSLSSNTQVLFFDAADEPWKTREEGASGAHWGFLTTDFVLKDCYADLNPFRQDYAVSYVSGAETGDETGAGTSDGSGAGTGAAVSLKNNTGAAAELAFFTASYDRNGRMIAASVDSKRIGAAESVHLTVSYGNGDRVDTVRAFVLDPDTLAPLRKAWEWCGMGE